MRYVILWALLRVYVWVARRPALTIKGLDGSPYLTRWHLFGNHGGEWGRPGWYLHFFHRSDYDRALHNHPWVWCKIWVLKGGYTETRAWNLDHVGSKELMDLRLISRRPGAKYTLLAMHYHRTTLHYEDRGSWSLVHAGPKHGRRWGFARRAGFQYAGDRSQDGVEAMS